MNLNAQITQMSRGKTKKKKQQKKKQIDSG